MIDRKVTILIVDDDSSIRFSLGQMFRTMGHSVRTAEDGFYALDEIALAIPDILISDLNMPRMSGYELLSIVRRRFPSAYVIAMSGSLPQGTISEAIAADGLYEKAAGMAALLKAVEDGIDANRFSVWASRKSTPIWVSPDDQHLSDSNQIWIACPNCLRAFMREIYASRSVEDTSCTHCGAGIGFAVVEQCA